MSTALNRSNVIARGIAVVAAAILLVVLIEISGGSSYTLKLALANASGLRSGSQVLLGGVEVGKVERLDVNRRNVVIATLKLSQGDVRVGAGASAAIVAANLLGEKYVALKPGNSKRPLPSGTTLSQAATILPTDLDQVVDVLDGGTRARLAILLDEAGMAVAGRKSDVSALLRQLPLSLTAGTHLLDTTVADNHTLADLVSQSNHFISVVNGQSRDLKRVIGASDGAARTLALRASDLAKVVAGAPEALRTYARFADYAGHDLLLLHPALLAARSAAPALDQLLQQVKPFTLAAVPALNRAAAVAPTLTRLAVQGTPTVKQAVPMLSALQHVASLSKPLSAWLGLSAGDLINITGDWASAIQFRDGASHIFNGEFYLDPSLILNAADKGATPAQKRQNLLDVRNPAYLRAMGLLGEAAKLRATKLRAQVNTSTNGPGHRSDRPTRGAIGTPTGGSATIPARPTAANVGTKSMATKVGISGLLNGLGQILSGGTQTNASRSSASSSSLTNLVRYLLGK